MNAGDAKLLVRDLAKSYTIEEGFGRLSRVHALRGLDLEVRDGELFTVIGPSGCGKSTFLMVVAGIYPFDSGTLLLDGQPISEPGLDRGVVFQDFALFPWMTVANNVKFGLTNKGRMSREEQDAVARDYLRLVNLQDFADIYPHRLSGGMQQRVAIARALATEPEILLMDEPFGSLDAQTRKSLQRQLLDIWRGTRTTIVFVTHSVREAVFLSQRVAILSGRPGRVVEIIDIDLTYDERLSMTGKTMEYERRLEDLIERQIVDDGSAVGDAIVPG